MKKFGLVQLFFMSILNPLILLNLYGNISGRDYFTTNAEYKFSLTLESISFNYFYPMLLFFISGLTLNAFVIKFTNKKASYIVNYIFSSLFMWLLIFLFGMFVTK